MKAQNNNTNSEPNRRLMQKKGGIEPSRVGTRRGAEENGQEEQE
jgi:hypothetical protein